jgi:nitroreductase
VRVLFNQVIETINKRRSIRSYDAKPVPRDVIKTIIEAGNQAPFTSITRSQPWRFVVVENPEFRQKLFSTTFPFWKNATEGMKKTYPDIYKMAVRVYDAMDEPKDVIYYNAPVIIFVLGPANDAVSCALACENIMIAATSLGLGSCYVGFGSIIRGDADVVKTLDLKDDEAVYGPILLGYPKIDPSEALSSALRYIEPNKREPKTKWI